jgi:hypothetical protein
MAGFTFYSEKLDAGLYKLLISHKNETISFILKKINYNSPLIIKIEKFMGQMRNDEDCILTFYGDNCALKFSNCNDTFSISKTNYHENPRLTVKEIPNFPKETLYESLQSLKEILSS